MRVTCTSGNDSIVGALLVGFIVIIALILCHVMLRYVTLCYVCRYACMCAGVYVAGGVGGGVRPLLVAEFTGRQNKNFR